MDLDILFRMNQPRCYLYVKKIWIKSYLHPRQATDDIAHLTSPRYGTIYALVRGVMLSLLFYLPLST